MKFDLATNMLSLPPALLLLVVSQATAAQAPARQLPTAIRKMPPDGGAKVFPEYMAFNPEFSYEAARIYPQEDAAEAGRFGPGFNLHERDEEKGAFRRAAEVLGVLQRRESCPPSMNSCESVGHPNKCCSEKEECVKVENPSVGNVACCPQGIDCDGGVGICPADAVTCSEELGGGCCIKGYKCKGTGCVRDNGSDDESSGPTTMTTTSTTLVDGSASTVVVTVVTTQTHAPSTATRTTVVTESGSSTSSSGAGAPFRPTNGDSGPSNSFCPTGFYACEARAGGGCCQTGRDCETTSCPPVEMTTIVTQGVTIAVPVDDVPDSEATQTCAGGWFLCDEDDDEDEAGCCPDGYKCGKESCSVSSASETAEVQKIRPGSGAARVGSRAMGILGCLGVFGVLHLL